jgi:hypothetical protein
MKIKERLRFRIALKERLKWIILKMLKILKTQLNLRKIKMKIKITT